MASSIKANEALDAQREAAEAEGIFEPTAEEKALLKRWGALKARKGKIDVEMAAIEDQIFEGMKAKGARSLTENGKNLALISPATSTKFDIKAFRAAYAALAQRFTISTPGERKAIKV